MNTLQNHVLQAYTHDAQEKGILLPPTIQYHEHEPTVRAAYPVHCAVQDKSWKYLQLTLHSKV
jgi:hypothetical protein